MESGVYMTSQFLRDIDNFSMAHFIEARALFLYRRLFDYVFGLQSRFKLKDGRKKPLLVDALTNPLPTTFAMQPKRGFTFPIESWLRTDLRASFEAFVLDPRNADFWDIAAVRGLWQAMSIGVCHGSSTPSHVGIGHTMRSFNDHAIDAFLRAEIDRLPVRAGMRLLDLGCGARPYAPLYREKFEECVAGDYVGRTADLDLRLDAQALPFGNNLFDCVLFSEVVEHVPEASKAIAEISRVLRPGGALLITWPFMYMMHEMPNDYVRFTEFGMARLLASNGLKVVVLARRGGALALAFVIAEFLLGGFLEALARLPVCGRLLKPVRAFLLGLLFALPTRGYFALLRRHGLTYRRQVGEALSGWRGHLDHWTLGYCVLARKEGGS